eukprot:TRINITY_DN6275_c0_g1_i2.p3 TRINITY_DN6275_c0_g1~~TRINITY_DN6275_c0_g1_i2.p3  ORF type:complete len:261 (+),score=86.06 TRINITY_DN6275_c0_g1_i2:1505-2287(+)
MALRVMDCFLCDGRTAMHQAGLALLYLLSEQLLQLESREAALELLCGKELLKNKQFEEKSFIKLALSFDVFVPEEQDSDSDEFEEPENPSKILTTEQFSLLVSWMSRRYQVLSHDMHVVYTTEVDGFNLHRMYEQCHDNWPIAIVIKSAENNVFGAFIADPLEVRCGRYYGTGDSFLFTLTPVPARYGWSRSNRYFLCAEHNQLALGGGSSGGASGYGLVIDDELRYGSSVRCDTFKNEPLNGGKQRFECVALEVISCVD